MNKPLRILYLGDDHPHSTSRHRAEALKRIGCDVTIVNPRCAYAHLKIHPKLNQLTGYRLVAPLVHRWVKQQIRDKQFDVAWVSQCPEVFKETVRELKGTCGKAVNYVNDDPTGNRDGNHWATFRQSIPLYDLFAVVRTQSELEFRLAGAKKVVRVWMSYDEVAHAPFAKEEDIPQAFRSEVAFVGTWMSGEGTKGRDYFLLKLIEAGIHLSIWGIRWQKSPCWPKLKPFWRGGALGGREYVAAIQGAKISLGFLSKGNRDLHTTRSAEIPYAGGLLCAERTSEHLQMYQDGGEAVFWSSPEECIQQCQELLKDDARRKQIRDAGMARVRALRLGNETICRRVLVELGYEYFQSPAVNGLFRMQSVN